MQSHRDEMFDRYVDQPTTLQFAHVQDDTLDVSIDRGKQMPRQVKHPTKRECQRLGPLTEGKECATALFV